MPAPGLTVVAAPATLLRGSLEYRSALRMVLHQRQTKLQRVSTGSMSHFVEKAFQIDSVLVHVHAAPKSGTDGRLRMA